MRVLFGSLAAAFIVLGLMVSSASSSTRCELASALPALSPDRISAHGCEADLLARQQRAKAPDVVLANVR